MLLSLVWLSALLFSIVCSVLTGNTAELGAAVFQGAQSAVTLLLSMSGSICLWSAVLTAAQNAGLLSGLCRLLRPILRRLFPKTSENEEAASCLSANLCANFLGFGNAATPLGLRAVKAMRRFSPSGAADDEMCLFVVLNTASLQCIPATAAALRAGLGAASAFDILPAVWLSAAASVGAALLASRLFCRWWPK